MFGQAVDLSSDLSLLFSSLILISDFYNAHTFFAATGATTPLEQHVLPVQNKTGTKKAA